MTISRVLLPYNTDRHTHIYPVGFEPANSGLRDEQFTANAVVSRMCTFSVSVGFGSWRIFPSSEHVQIHSSEQFVNSG